MEIGSRLEPDGCLMGETPASRLKSDTCEFQPLFRRTLLGSAIVSDWVSDEGGRRLSRDGRLDEIMCGQRWRSEYVLREVDR